MRELIYLASPYSHRLGSVRLDRTVQVCRITARLIERNQLVYSPIAASTRLTEYGDMADTWNQWREYDREFLSKCDVLYVATMPGWRESVGVSCEIAWAKRFGMPIFMLDPDTLRVLQMLKMEIERCVSFVADRGE